MADLDNKLVTFASLKETVTRMKEYANQFEPRKEVISKAKLTYSTNYIRAYCDYVATIPTTVRVTDDDGSVLLITGSDSGSWRAVRLIKGETDRFHKVYYSNGYVYIQVDNDSMYTVFGGSSLKVFGSATGTEIQIEDLSTGGDLTDYQEKTDNTLTTTDKTVTGAINEINSNLLDTVGFSADYKNIILNRKSGLNPYTIPISAIINNTSLSELKDIDSTDVGNGKTLVYDSATQKHKYVNTTGTDEFVKMDSTTDANYLSNLIDKSTVVNENGVLKVKKLDGQEVTITEINYLKGLTMNVMDLVNAFANGGVKVLNTPLNTASELDTMDRTSFTDGISYIVYVLADETHSNAKTTYLCTKTSTTFFGNADSQRNFTTNPIDLANEVTGKLGTSNIDVDSLWTLLTINDTYKTLTTNNEIFGTHGAKAMYDELITAIGKKANTSDIPTEIAKVETELKGNIKEINDSLVDKQDFRIYNSIEEFNKKKGTSLTVVSGIDNMKDIVNAMRNGEMLIITISYISDSDVYFGFNTSTGWTKMFTFIKANGLCDVECRTTVPSTFKRVFNADGAIGDWQELATMDKVKDVGKTTLTPVFPSGVVVASGGVAINYVVKNGWCNVNFAFNITSAATFSWTDIATGLPKPANSVNIVLMNEQGKISRAITIRINSDGSVSSKAFEISNADWWYGNISYPVA